MGNSNQGRFLNRDWVLDHRSHNFDVCHDGKGTYAEKHVIPNNPKVDQDDEMEIYGYRNSTDKPIVKVYEADFTQSGSACKTEPEIEVYSEYIPHRLSDTHNLNNGQALYVLSQSLAGFHELHNRFGPFTITDDHIGFNDQGEAKVWMSPNFATNHLPHDGIILMSTENPKHFDDKIQIRQEQEMVEDIWLTVDDHALIDPQLRTRADNFQEMSFIEARKLIAQEIEREYCYVPEYLNFQNSRKLSPNMSRSRSRNNPGQSRASNTKQYIQGGSPRFVASEVNPYPGGNLQRAGPILPPQNTY